jgi:hypothetical protein
MAYGTYDKHVCERGDAQTAMTSAAIEAATGELLVKTVLEPITVSRFGVQIKPGANIDYDNASPTLCEVALYKYPLGVSGSKVLLGSFEIPDGALAGAVLFADIDNKLGAADFNTGDQVAVVIKTQGAGGTEVGDIYPYFTFNPRAEVAANMSLAVDMTTVPVTGND